MRTIGVEERRARLGRRHRLARPVASVEEAVADLVGLLSSDPSSVYLSAWARVEGFAPGDLEEALYERRSLVRMLGMRRTLFVVPVDLAAVMDEACAKALAPGERRRLVGMLEGQGIVGPGEGERWLERVAADTLAALRARGEATARELAVELLEPVDNRTRKAIEAERERLGDWLGGVRIIPRFRTPLEKALAIR